MIYNCDYRNRIAKRSLWRFLVGLYPRVKKFVEYSRNRKIVRRRGGRVGDDSIILRGLSNRANSNLTIGNDSSIGSVDLDTRSPIKIGNHVIISNDSRIITTSHNIDSPEWEHKYYGIEIEDYVWIASHVTILPSCRKIGRGAVIGAGSVVVKDVPPMAVVGGNPAQFIKERKQVHNKLVIPSLLSGDLKIYWNTWINRKK